MSAVVTIEAQASRSRSGLMPRAARRLAWALWVLGAALVALMLLVVVATLSAVVVPGYIRGTGALLALGYATIGVRIAERHPRNAVGWLILITGVSFAIIALATEWVIGSVTAPADIRPSEAAVRAVWIVNFVPTVTGSLFLLLFPHGQLASRRWLILAALAIVFGLVGSTIALLTPLPPLSASANPLQAAGEVFIANPLFVVASGGTNVVLALCAGTLVLRLRAARGDERQQLKWVAAAGVFAGITLLVTNFGPPSEVLEYLNLAGILSFPVAAGLAMRRYRLYDIDAILNRTLVYVIVTALLAGLTAALLESGRRLFIALTGQTSDAAIVITTLIVVAVFTPLRDVVQRVLDERLRAPVAGLKGLRSFAEEVREFAHFSARDRLVVRLLAESVTSLDAVGGAAEILESNGTWSVRESGRWNGDAHISASIDGPAGPTARLRLGPRRDGESYSKGQLAQLRDAVNAVAEALSPA